MSTHRSMSANSHVYTYIHNIDMSTYLHKYIYTYTQPFQPVRGSKSQILKPPLSQWAPLSLQWSKAQAL